MFRFLHERHPLPSLRICLVAYEFLLLFSPSFARAEDVKKRAEGLLKKAHEVSSYQGVQPPFREIARLVVRDGQNNAEGQYTREFASPRQQREELVVGAFRELWVRTNGQIWDRKQGEFDASMVERLRTSLAPHPAIQLFYFDRVLKIESEQTDGIKTDCIFFERTPMLTANKICIEKERGVLLLWSRGELTTQYSEYGPFASKLLPRRVTVSENGTMLFDAKIEFAEVKDFAAATFLPPPDAQPQQIVQACTQTPAPKLKTQYDPIYPKGKRVVGVVTISAEIGKDGRVRDAHVATPGDKDLDAAAIEAVQRWLFDPATCDGSPIAVHMTIEVHFRPN